MHRPRIVGLLLAPILFTIVFLTVACSGGGQEQAILQNFFRASKARDTVTLGNIAATSYNKSTEGTVDRFSVVSVSEERVQPLHLKELAEAHEAARKADEEFTTRKRAFQDQHIDEVNALQKGEKLKGKAAEQFLASWNKWVEETKTSAKKVSDAREALSAERSIADISTFNPQTPVDPTQYEGELATKDYTISADCTLPDGKHTKKTLIVTLQQARLKADKPIVGKWIVTNIKEQGAGGTT